MYIYKFFWGVLLGFFGDWFGFLMVIFRNLFGINVLFWKRYFYIIYVILLLWFIGEVIYYLKVIKIMGGKRRKRNVFRKYIISWFKYVDEFLLFVLLLSLFKLYV